MTLWVQYITEEEFEIDDNADFDEIVTALREQTGICDFEDIVDEDNNSMIS